MTAKNLLAATAAAFALQAAPALADDACTPRLVASIAMTAEADGRYAIPVMIDGAPHRMLLATSSAHTVVFQDFASAADLKQSHLPDHRNFSVFGGKATGSARMDSVSVGGQNASGVEALVSTAHYAADSEVVGTIGVDLLANFDIDLDFRHGTLNLFASNDCADKSVYWASRFTTLPLDPNNFSAAMELDGKPLSVAFDTLAPGTGMRFDAANELFGLDEHSGGVTQAGTNEEGEARYAYQFKALTGGDIAIGPLTVSLYGAADAIPCDGKRHHKMGALPYMNRTTTCHSSGDLWLGTRELKAFHIYIAYKARKIYVTDAAVHRT